MNTTIRELPPFLRDLLNSPPRAGEGVHNWLFTIARQLHAHLPSIEIVTLLESRIADCGRRVSRDEIEDAVKNSIHCAWQPNQSTVERNPSKWPERNSEKIEAIRGDGYGLIDLWEASRVRIEDNEQHAEEIIDRLFPGNPLLCCGKSQSEFDTKPREDWRGELSQLQFIVPSPMSAVSGLTKDGRESKHTLENTSARRFLICEFDTGSTDEHAALLRKLKCQFNFVFLVFPFNGD